MVCDITWFKAKKENLCDKYHDHEVTRNVCVGDVGDGVVFSGDHV